VTTPLLFARIRVRRTRVSLSTDAPQPARPRSPALYRSFIDPHRGGYVARDTCGAYCAATLPRWDAAQIRRGTDLLQWVISHLVTLQKSGTFAERFPFLLEPYVKGADPLDQAWDAAVP